MQIAIIGLGEHGAALAQVFAVGGDAVLLVDTAEHTLRRALAQISRGLGKTAEQGHLTARAVRHARRVFTLSTDLARCAEADLVIEALPDRLEDKRTLFRALDDIVRPDAVLATTASALSVTQIATATRYPERVVGLHMWRPAHRSAVVELIRTPLSRQDVLDVATDLVRRVEKRPITLEDTPGWITNRLAQAYFGEALLLLENGDALDASTIDRLLEATGFELGPFRQMDALGIERVLAVARALFEATFHQSAHPPHPRLVRMTQAGLTGRKSARGGFYPATPARK